MDAALILLGFIIFLGVILPLILIAVSWIREHVFAKNCKKSIQKLSETTLQSYPWLAAQIADIEWAYDEETAARLRAKKRPAMKAADELSKIAKEKRELKQQCKMYEYQLTFLLSAIPWIKDYEEIAPIEAFSLANPETSDEEKYEKYKNWLSPSEYSSLPPAKKYQLALERYFEKPANTWEAGVMYERYIGFLLERKDYFVTYSGALEGREDMGRDLIAEKGNETLIVQCKRYSGHPVRENTVFQTFGSAMHYQAENESRIIKSVIYSTGELSDIALKCAKILKVDVYQNVPLEKYPMIKCNISRNGEKIYHLPFDQQYDKVVISQKKGEFYAKTVAEAEAKGFRRAFRWRGST